VAVSQRGFTGRDGRGAASTGGATGDGSIGQHSLAIEAGLGAGVSGLEHSTISPRPLGVGVGRRCLQWAARRADEALRAGVNEVDRRRKPKPKTMNVLNCFPKASQAKVKQALHSIWQAETKDHAETAFDLFITTYEAKYPKATLCLQKDHAELMAFYDFPAHHWQSIRTSNPIESSFATIRRRTKRSKGCLSRDGMLHMIFK
jgi:putative transposase